MVLKRNEPLYIIAEAGCEHLGDMKRARQLVDAATNADADCVKFQLFYQDEVGDKVWEQIKNYHLSTQQLEEISAYCRFKKIDFLCSAFGLQSLKDLFDLGHNIIKVPSPCNQWEEYIKTAVEAFDWVLVSTGMLDEEGFNELLEMAKPHVNKLKILHCVSGYPLPYEQANMRVLQSRLLGSRSGTISRAYHGFSDHSRGNTLAVGAVALGATILEKHLTLLDKAGPDSNVALKPYQFYWFVKACRDMHRAMGHADRQIMNCERDLLWRKTL